MSQPESGHRQSVWEKQSGESRAPFHHPQITKVLFGWGKEEREEVISEERSIGPEIKKPVSIFQKQLLRKRQASDREYGCAALRQSAGNSSGGREPSVKQKGVVGTVQNWRPLSHLKGAAPASCMGSSPGKNEGTESMHF